MTVFLGVTISTGVLNWEGLKDNPSIPLVDNLIPSDRINEESHLFKPEIEHTRTKGFSSIWS